MTQQHHLLAGLNQEQEAAVASGARFLRVLAGAGSGKTRVLVHRAAFLIQECQVSPYGILAVTFTNKAAQEMRSRIESLCGLNTRGMWVGTFHGLAHRLLRIHYKDAGLEEQFQIIDPDDQLRFVKRIHKELKIQDADFAPKQSVSFINREKDEGRYPLGASEEVQPFANTLALKALDRQSALMQEVYKRYQSICEQSNLVDFAELLLRSLTLLETKPEIAAFYQRKFEHILVDEFQDTNAIQFRWLEAMLSKTNALTIVGDDDQSIYGWRGAQVENILRFSERYPDTETVRLEQNYRSTKSILGAANGVIACNQDRLGKSLWTQGEQGALVRLYSAYNEVDEAKFVVERIMDHKSKGIDYKQQAVLYRSNAQSRVLEEAFLYARVPYRIYGGQRFFDRAEIKNAMAYLRLVAMPDDDAAFERVVNFPTRGLGDRSLQVIRDEARAAGVSLWQASTRVLEQKKISTRAGNGLAGFMGIIQDLQQASLALPLSGLAAQMLSRSQLASAYAKEPTEQRQTREENLKELISATAAFDAITDFQQEDMLDPSMRDLEEDFGFLPARPSTIPEIIQTDTSEPAQRTAPGLAAFLDHVSLESGEMQAARDADAVQLMTLHSSKGLEFPIVFLVGLEEGLFPSQMSMNEPGRIEEERRLCYVGMTRAEQFLTLSYAESRRIYGEERRSRVSRFVREIPAEFLEEIRLGNIAKPAFAPRVQPARTVADQSSSDFADDQAGVSIGSRVMHRAFGEGVVLATEGRGVRMRVQVNFTRAGTKWLMANVAKLEPIDMV